MAATAPRATRTAPGASPAPGTPPTAAREAGPQRPGAKRSGGLLGLGGLKVVLVAALEIAAGVALTAAGRAAGAAARASPLAAPYELYELHLSTHDQAKPQDLEDMVESIANIVRAWPADRVRHGQPYLALELICGGAPSGRRPGDGVVDQRPLRARRRSPRSTARSAPPTPTCGSAASTASSPGPEPACCASPGT